MAQTVEIPGIGAVEFPDEMSEGQILTKVRELSRRQTTERPEAVYKNPPSKLDWARHYARELVKEGIPLAGLLGGGAAGALAAPVSPAGPLSPLIGAGLGYAGGKQAVGLLENLGMIQGPPSPSPPTLGGVAHDVISGAAMEASGPLGAMALRASGAPARAMLGISKATPEDLAVRAAAERLNIPLTAGSASASAPVSLIESVPSRFPIGRQTAEASTQATRLGMQRAAERQAAAYGPTKTLEEAGQSIKAEVGRIARWQEQAPTELVDRVIQSLAVPKMGRMALGGSLQEAGKAAQATRRHQASVAYDAAIAGRGAEEIPLEHLQRRAGEIAAFERRLRGVDRPPIRIAAEGLERTASAAPIRASDLSDEALGALLQQGKLPQGPFPINSLTEDFIERYGLQTYGTRTLEEAIAIQQRLRGLVRNAPDDLTRRNLRQLSDAVSSDIEAFAGPGALADASKFYRDEVAAFFSRKAPLRKALEGRASQLTDRIVSGQNPELIADAMKVFPARQQAEIQRAVLDRLRQKSLDKGTGEVDPARLEAEFRRLGDETLGLVFGPKIREVDALRKTLSQNFGRDTSQARLTAMLTASPESIVNTMAKGKIKSAADFDAVWGTLSPATRNEARSALFDEVLRFSVDPKSNQFSIDRFLTQKSLVPQEIWDRMLSQNAGAALRDLTLVGQRISRFNQVAANPSQTGGAILGPSQILGGAGIAASTVMGREDPESFALKVFGLLSPALIGLAVFSKTGQRALTSQVPRAINPQGLVPTLTKAGAAGLYGDE